jgi:N-acetylmuramoyl-L-alanine amidase
MTQTYKITENLLTKNDYSRPGTKFKKIKGIVIHWVANPNTSALANRNFFENRKNGSSGYGSAHEIIDLDGSVLVDIPPSEMAYHVGSTQPYTTDALKYLGTYPNNCTYGIECTHLDWNGKMADATYETLVNRVVDLMKQFNLVGTEKPLWLHQEVVGWKDCHRWFVNNPTEWTKFKNKINERCEEMSDVLKLNEEWEWNMLLENVKQLKAKGYIAGDSWETKVKNKTITAHELAWLNAEVLSRLIK